MARCNKSPLIEQSLTALPSTACCLFRVTCYRSLGAGLSVPDTWISGQSRESAEYHARNGRSIERRDAGCYHGPFLIIPDNDHALAAADKKPQTQNPTTPKPKNPKTTMSDLKCPYCHADNDVCHDDGQGYEEDKAHKMECCECDKHFIFFTSISFDYSPRAADCLNDSPHTFDSWRRVHLSRDGKKETQQCACKVCHKTEQRMFTIPHPESKGGLQPHQQRVVEEQVELSKKITKLDEFIDLSPVYAGLPDKKKDQLLRQRGCMVKYREVLKERIGEF